MSRRVRPGQKLPDGTVIVKAAEGGMRRIRCPACQGLAMPINNTQGKAVLRCTACGRQWTSQVM